MRTSRSSPPPIAIRDRRFVTRRGGSDRVFVPWGFNYEWTLVDGRLLRLEDLLRERPDVLAADFADMRRLGANTLRVFLPTAEILAAPATVDAAALERMDLLFGLSSAHRLRLIVTGLAHIRSTDTPHWLLEASDRTVARAEATFWKAVARAARGARAVLAFDLQNEPAVHWFDSRRLTSGSKRAPGGERFSYVHLHYRQVGARWTSDVHRRFRCEAALRRHWADYPRPGESWSRIALPRHSRSDPRYFEYLIFHGRLLSRWARRLAEIIKREDSRRLVTVGPLDPRPMSRAVDFYSLHLYPRERARPDVFVARSSALWRAALAALPGNKPILIEEVFPLGLPRGIAPAALSQALADAGRERAAGCLSFYFGPPARLRRSVPVAALRTYEAWLRGFEQSRKQWMSGMS
jgi:hypothetical protein